MRATGEIGRWPADESGCASPALPRQPDIARLSAGCAALQTMVDCLRDLASDIHRSRRPDDARMLVDGLYVALARHLDDEADLLGAFAPGGGEHPDAALERTWANHVALRDLAVPVIQNLSAIARDELPVRTSRFVHVATALCEFIRLHLDHKRKTLYPLLADLEARRQRGFESNERLPDAANCWAVGIREGSDHGENHHEDGVADSPNP